LFQKAFIIGLRLVSKEFLHLTAQSLVVAAGLAKVCGPRLRIATTRLLVYLLDPPVTLTHIGDPPSVITAILYFTQAFDHTSDE